MHSSSNSKKNPFSIFVSVAYSVIIQILFKTTPIGIITSILQVILENGVRMRKMIPLHR